MGYKKEKLKILAKKRKKMLWNYNNYHDIPLPPKERFQDISTWKVIDDCCKYLNPRSNESDLNSELVFVLQDWLSEKGINKLKPDKFVDVAKIGYDKDRYTNKNLARCLMRLLNPKSYSEKKPIDWDIMKVVYITNLFHYIKPKDVSRAIRQPYLDNSFEDFTWKNPEESKDYPREIQIIQPKYIICLGEAVYYTFLKNLRPSYVLAKDNKTKKKRTDKPEIGDHFIEKSGELIYYQSHPSPRRQKVLGEATVKKNWEIMRKTLKL